MHAKSWIVSYRELARLNKMFWIGYVVSLSILQVTSLLQCLSMGLLTHAGDSNTMTFPGFEWPYPVCWPKMSYNWVKKNKNRKEYQQMCTRSCLSMQYNSTPMRTVCKTSHTEDTCDYFFTCPFGQLKSIFCLPNFCFFTCPEQALMLSPDGLTTSEGWGVVTFTWCFVKSGWISEPCL